MRHLSAEIHLGNVFDQEIIEAIRDGRARATLHLCPLRLHVTTETEEQELVRVATKVVADFFKMEPAALSGIYGNRLTTDAKAALRYILSHENGISLKRVADLLDLTNHSTVQKSNELVKRMLETDENWPKMIKHLNETIQKEMDGESPSP